MQLVCKKRQRLAQKKRKREMEVRERGREAWGVSGCGWKLKHAHAKFLETSHGREIKFLMIYPTHYFSLMTRFVPLLIGAVCAVRPYIWGMYPGEALDGWSRRPRAQGIIHQKYPAAGAEPQSHRSIRG